MSRNCQDMIEDSVEWAENFMKSSVWRYPKSEQNRIPKFFPIPKFFDTESDTKFFRYWIRFFFIPIFFVPISILFFVETKIFRYLFWNYQKHEKVSKPERHPKYPKSEQNWIRKFFWYQIHSMPNPILFWYQIFPILNPILFYTESATFKKMENLNVTLWWKGQEMSGFSQEIVWNGFKWPEIVPYGLRLSKMV